MFSWIFPTLFGGKDNGSERISKPRGFSVRRMSGRKRAPQVRRPSARQNAEFPLPLFPEVLRGTANVKAGARSRPRPPCSRSEPQNPPAHGRKRTGRGCPNPGKPSGTPRLRAKGPALPRLHDDEGNDHLLHRDAAVLERIVIIAHETVRIVRIDEKVAVVGENIGGRDVRLGQVSLLGFRDREHLLGVEAQVAAGLIAQVGRRLAVALHADRTVHLNRAVVRRDDDRVPAIGDQPHQLQQVRVLEPRTRERAERRLVLGQIADDLRFGPRMRQDIEEVIDDYREVGGGDPVEILDQPLARVGLDDLVEKQLVALALRLHLPAQEIFLVLILASVLVVVEPQIGHDLVDRQRRQPGENRVARILGGRRQNAAIESLKRS